MKLLTHEAIFPVSKRPTNNCHASTVLTCNGGLLAAWFGGTKEGNNDVGILYSRRINGAWESPRMLPKTKDEPHWNPVLFRMPNGLIYLFYKIGLTIPKWQTFYRVSTDEGATFGEEMELVAGDVGGRGPVKNKPILLSNGEVLAPASYEPGSLAETETLCWECFVDRTTDCGNTWDRTPYIERPEGLSAIQPTLWESPRGNVHMFTRTNGSFIYRSDSADYGRTWCKLYPLDIPNNNSGIDCALSEKGVLALVYNPVGSKWGKRTPLQVCFSTDNGQSFSEPLILQDGPGEFSYPAIIADGDRFHITFTGCRETIYYCEVEF